MATVVLYSKGAVDDSYTLLGADIYLQKAGRDAMCIDTSLSSWIP
jgi:hypothetical protein